MTAKHRLIIEIEVGPERMSEWSALHKVLYLLASHEKQGLFPVNTNGWKINGKTWSQRTDEEEAV